MNICETNCHIPKFSFSGKYKAKKLFKSTPSNELAAKKSAFNMIKCLTVSVSPSHSYLFLQKYLVIKF